MAPPTPSSLSPLEKIVATSLGVSILKAITKKNQEKIAKILGELSQLGIKNASHLEKEIRTAERILVMLSLGTNGQQIAHFETQYAHLIALDTALKTALQTIKHNLVTSSSGGNTVQGGNDTTTVNVGTVPTAAGGTRAPRNNNKRTSTPPGTPPAAPTLHSAPTRPTITSPQTFSVNTPTIEGETSPDSIVEIYEGTTKIGDGSADSSGDFQITTNRLPDGPHMITVKCINPADHTRVSQIPQRITIIKPLVLSPVSIDLSSLTIERNTSNPQILLKNTVQGSKIRITDTTGKILCDTTAGRPDASGNFKVTLRGLDVRNVGPQDITIEAIDPNDDSNNEPHDQTLTITEKKMAFTHPPKAALSKPGKQENNKSFSINLDDIALGARVKVTNPRIPSGSETFYTNSKTFSQTLYQIDTKIPSVPGVPEALIIQMVDPNDDTNVSAPFTLPFEIDYPTLSLERPEISQISGKLDPSDDIKFQMTNAVDESEVIVTGPGLSSAKRIPVPAGNGPDFDIDLGIKAGPPLVPGKSYEYTIQVDDPKHPGSKKTSKVKIEIDYPLLTSLTTPTINEAQPIDVKQGAPSKGFLTVNNAVAGAEYTLVLPNGTEVPTGKVTGTTHIISLNNLDISTVGPQTVFIKVKDPHHDTIPSLQSSVDLEIKKKVEVPKHLPQPHFKVPVDYRAGSGKDPEIEILNAVANTEIDITYPGGPTPSIPIKVTADGVMSIPLIGFNATPGSHTVRVSYRDPTTPPKFPAPQNRDIPMHVLPGVGIERPEGLLDEIDTTTKPSQIKIGKLKPGQTLTVTGPNGPVATSMASDDTYTFSIPGDIDSTKHNYVINVADAANPTGTNFPITLNVKVPPKGDLRINHHNFVHGCKEARENSTLGLTQGAGHYLLNGHTPPRMDVHYSGRGRKFYRGGISPQYWTVVEGERFSSSDPEKLFKMVKEHLDQHNQHEKDEYNAYWGLMPESSAHTPEESEKGKDGKEKGEKEKGDHKDDKGHDDHKDEGGTKYDKVVNKIFGNGIIGKTFKGVRNMIPKGIRGLTGAAFDGAVAGTVVGGGLYLTGAALGSAAIASLIVPATGLAFAGWGLYSAGKRFMKWRASRGGSESKGGGH